MTSTFWRRRRSRAPTGTIRQRRRSISKPKADEGKPERSSLSHYSTRDHGGRSGGGSTKAALPQWSAAAYESGMDGEEPESAGGGGTEEMFEE